MNGPAKGTGVTEPGQGERELLRAVAGLPVPHPGAEWAEGLPGVVLAEASRREEELLAAVAALPVPDPPAGFFDDLPGLVRGGTTSRKLLPFRQPAWWWAGGVAAAATVLLALQFSPSPLSQPADAEFILAVNSSSLSLGSADDLVSAGDAGQDWLGSLDEVGLEQLEESGVYQSPVPAGWDDVDEGVTDDRTSRVVLVENG